MSRMSCDQYRLPNGVVVNVPTAAILNDVLKDGGVLFNGYDYEKQEWVYQGKKDTRTLEQLRAAIAAKSV